MTRWWIVWTLLIAISVAASVPAQAEDNWPQWGGPARDFTVEARNLSRDWGESGPARLWSRPLGGGFASIVGDARRLYTAYRDGDDEILIALDAASGETAWEYRYAAPVPKSPALSTQYGKGPNGTPLLVDGKLVTLGFTGQVHCVDAKQGKKLWSHDLAESNEVRIPYFGHATSPLLVGRNVVMVAGGLLAFELESGKLAWENREFAGSYGSPRLLQVGDEQQIVTPVAGRIAGFDAATGETLWSHEHKNQWGTILISPLFDDAGRVFISAAEVGSLLVDPSATADEARQVWKSGETQIAHSNAVRSGDWVFGSVGDATSFLTGTSLVDGKQAWKERSFARANLLRVGDEFLLLDHDGELALVELSGEGAKVVTQTSIADEPTWTPPTLIGTTLYARNEARIMALDLSARTAK